MVQIYASGMIVEVLINNGRYSKAEIWLFLGVNGMSLKTIL